MELGHILWPSDPVTRESSDPETQLTRWPCSIMNSKCWLMCSGVRIELFTARVLCRVSYRLLDKVSKKVRVFISGAKKQDLHRPKQGYICPVIVWQTFAMGKRFASFYVQFAFWAFFSWKPEKTRVSHRVKMMTRWPGRERWPKWPIYPVTQWPSSMSGEGPRPSVRGVRIVVNSTLGVSSLREGFAAISTFSHTDCLCY